MKLLSLDIETACALGCPTKCEHALDSFRNIITVVGLVEQVGDEYKGQVFRSIPVLREYLASLGEYGILAHNGKFDLRSLYCHGLDVRDKWVEDTHLIASTLLEKVPLSYMESYENERKRRHLTSDEEHRKAGKHSLKILAPYFLGVEPFWEVSDKDNDEYVLKDAEYTLRLFSVLKVKLEKEGNYAFYKEKLLPWTGLLLSAELRGIALDFRALEAAEFEAADISVKSKQILDTLWADAYAFHRYLEVEAVTEKYKEMAAKALEKSKDKSPEALGRVASRYAAMQSRAETKVEPLSLDSPAQLAWLLRDYLKLDIRDFDGEETTGIAVLERLASQGREDVAEFIKYRQATKLATAFFPSYREMAHNGYIHASFNPTGTRTGRLSCSRPNLQQVASNIKKVFVPRSGYSFAVKDEAAIEPRLIAYYTNDLNLYDIVSSGKDFHNHNTAIFFGRPVETDFKKFHPLEREVGKETGLLLIYGGGKNRIRESGQKRGFAWSNKEASYKFDHFRDYYQGVFKFREEVLNPILMSGQSVVNLLGRPFSIDDPTDVHMQGLNTLIQGSASDLVLNSANKAQRIYDELKLDAHVLILEHDLIIGEGPSESTSVWEPILVDAMTNYELNCALGPIPLKVEGPIASCWQK